MMPLHLSAYWQYSRHAADLSGRFHSAPHLGQVVLSSSAPDFKVSTTNVTFDVSWFWLKQVAESRACFRVFFYGLSLELNYFTSNLNLVTL